jgi:hypothetical protein
MQAALVACEVRASELRALLEANGITPSPNTSPGGYPKLKGHSPLLRVGTEAEDPHEQTSGSSGQPSSPTSPTGWGRKNSYAGRLDGFCAIQPESGAATVSGAAEGDQETSELRRLQGALDAEVRKRKKSSERSARLEQKVAALTDEIARLERTQAMELEQRTPVEEQLRRAVENPLQATELRPKRTSTDRAESTRKQPATSAPPPQPESAAAPMAAPARPTPQRQQQQRPPVSKEEEAQLEAAAARLEDASARLEYASMRLDHAISSQVDQLASQQEHLAYSAPVHSVGLPSSWGGIDHASIRLSHVGDAKPAARASAAPSASVTYAPAACAPAAIAHAESIEPAAPMRIEAHLPHPRSTNVRPISAARARTSRKEANPTNAADAVSAASANLAVGWFGTRVLSSGADGEAAADAAASLIIDTDATRGECAGSTAAAPHAAQPHTEFADEAATIAEQARGRAALQSLPQLQERIVREEAVSRALQARIDKLNDEFEARLLTERRKCRDILERRDRASQEEGQQWRRRHGWLATALEEQRRRNQQLERRARLAGSAKGAASAALPAFVEPLRSWAPAAEPPPRPQRPQSARLPTRTPAAVVGAPAAACQGLMIMGDTRTGSDNSKVDGPRTTDAHMEAASLLQATQRKRAAAHQSTAAVQQLQLPVPAPTLLIEQPPSPPYPIAPPQPVRRAPEPPLAVRTSATSGATTAASRAKRSPRYGREAAARLSTDCPLLSGSAAKELLAEVLSGARVTQRPRSAAQAPRGPTAWPGPGPTELLIGTQAPRAAPGHSPGKKPQRPMSARATMSRA